jgi:hypothetical protein
MRGLESWLVVEQSSHTSCTTTRSPHNKFPIGSLFHPRHMIFMCKARLTAEIWTTKE